MAQVVVAVPAQRLPEQLVAVVVAGVADGRPAVLAHAGLPLGVKGRQRAAAAGAVHQPERGRGQGREDQRVVARPCSGTPLPPVTPARIRWNVSAA